MTSDSSEMSWCTNWHLCWQPEPRAQGWGARGDHSSRLPNLEGLPAGLERDMLSPRPGWVTVAAGPEGGTGSTRATDWVPGIRVVLAAHPQLHFPTFSVLSEQWESVRLHGGYGQRRLLNPATPKQGSESCSLKGNQR